jgi:AraC-like DNA-binding protein
MTATGDAMANIVRRPGHWKQFSTPPVVHLEHAEPGWELREVEYGPGGSWDHVTTKLHIACHLDPIRQRIGGARAPFLLVPPSAAVSAPGDRLAGSWEGRGRGRHVHVSPGLVSAVLGREFTPQLIRRRHFARLREPDADDAIVGHLMSALALELRNGTRDSVLLQTIVGALIQHAVRQGRPVRQESAARGGLSPGQLRRALDMIEARLTGRPSLPDLATLLDVSTRYFCRAFRASTGLSPHQYILQRRVERARALIQQGELSLSEVAIAAGFADHSQMATTFRKLLHVPPSHFRRPVRTSGGPS